VVTRVTSCPCVIVLRDVSLDSSITRPHVFSQVNVHLDVRLLWELRRTCVGLGSMRPFACFLLLSRSCLVSGRVHSCLVSGRVDRSLAELVNYGERSYVGSAGLCMAVVSLHTIVLMHLHDEYHPRMYIHVVV